MEGSDDVYVHKFSMGMGGKTLFSDCKLSLAHGRRYGLIGAPHCARRGSAATPRPAVLQSATLTVPTAAAGRSVGHLSSAFHAA
eukprot:110246-Prymnesium_polylepis.1